MCVEGALCEKLDPSSLAAGVMAVDVPIGSASVAEAIEGVYPRMCILPRPDLD